MEKEEPRKKRIFQKSFFGIKIKRGILIFIALWIALGCKPENKNKISFKSLEEKNKIQRNYKIWQSLSPSQKKKWTVCQERFQKYSIQDKNFLRMIYRDWFFLPPGQKEEWKKALSVFHSLSPEQKSQLQYISIFYECYRFESHSLPCIKWIRRFENFFSKYEPLGPWNLRLYIYQTFKIGNILTNLPSDIQKHWLNLSAQARLKIYAKIEKKLEQENYSFLFQALKQELKPKLGDE